MRFWDKVTLEEGIRKRTLNHRIEAPNEKLWGQRPLFTNPLKESDAIVGATFPEAHLDPITPLDTKFGSKETTPVRTGDDRLLIRTIVDGGGGGGSLPVHTHLTPAQGGTLSATAIASGILGIPRGGTNAGSFTANQLVRANAVGSALQSAGITVAQISLVGHVHSAADITSGTLAQARGGTNATTYAASEFIRQNAGNTAFEASGFTGASFAAAAHTHAPADITPQGAGSGLDADLLDGLSSAAFALASHTHSAADITSGTLAQARGGTNNGAGYAALEFIRQNAGNTAFEASGFTSASFAAAAHTHPYTDITGVPAVSLLGNSTGAPTVADDITLNSTLEFSGTTLRRAALTGSVSASAGSNTTTIADAHRRRSHIIYIENPTATDEFPICFVPSAATLVRIVAVTDTGTVDFNINKRATTTPDVSGTDVDSSEFQATSGGLNDTSFSSAAISADNWLHYSASAVASSPTKVWISVTYTVDNV